jgi:hypothetical protein
VRCTLTKRDERVARHNDVKRGAPGARAQKPSEKLEFGRISLCINKFRLGARIIGGSKNRPNPMQIINFHLGASITGKFGHFAVSLLAPSYYGWAPR